MAENQEQISVIHSEFRGLYENLKQSVEQYDLVVYGCIRGAAPPHGCGDSCSGVVSSHPAIELLEKVKEYLDTIDQ